MSMEKRPAHLLFVHAFEGSTPPDESAPLTIKRCKILGLESRHGRKFTEAALKDAYERGIYEGLTIYKDHPVVDFSDPNWAKKPLPPRSVDDVLGSFANVVYMEGQGLFGDAVFTVDSDLTRSVCLSARTNPRQYGFSHHAVYDNIRMEGATEIVGSIPQAFSVDLVTRPATTNGLFEGDAMSAKSQGKSGNGAGTPPAKNDAAKPTVRSVLEGLCTVGIAKKVVRGLEGDYMDAPMAPMAEGVSVEDQISAAFRTAGMAIFDDAGMDDKAKLGKLKELFAAKSKLAGTDSASDSGSGSGANAAKEGDDAPADDKDKKDKAGTESAPGKPIGQLEAMNLLEKHKLPITRVAVESYSLLPMSIAESQAVQAAAREKEITDLKGRLDLATNGTPRSLPRTGLEGVGAGGDKPSPERLKQISEKPWLQFSDN